MLTRYFWLVEYFKPSSNVVVFKNISNAAFADTLIPGQHTVLSQCHCFAASSPSFKYMDIGDLTAVPYH